MIFKWDTHTLNIETNKFHGCSKENFEGSYLNNRVNKWKTEIYIYWKKLGKLQYDFIIYANHIKIPFLKDMQKCNKTSHKYSKATF